MPTRTPVRPLHVIIVSDNPETIDGLENYLRGAGVTTQSTRFLEKALEMIPVLPAALVLFPDNFAKDAVFATVTVLQAQRPRTLAVLVTGEPKRFQALPSIPGALPPLVVQRPAWGWTILDAIRANVDITPAKPKGHA